MPRPEDRGGVLLDTHALLWWQAESPRLSERALTHIENAQRVLVSPISFWEVAMLVGKGRIALDRATSVWVADLLASERIEIAALSPEVAVLAGELTDMHGDPADRLIYATARQAGATLITKDVRIRNSAAGDSHLTVTW